MSLIVRSKDLASVDTEDLRGLIPALPLRGKGEAIRAWTFVDPDVYEWASKFRWHLHEAKGRTSYVARRAEGQTAFLHREVLGLTRGDGQEADHIDGDGLNNRRSNLRVTTHAQNHQNKAAHRGSKSRYRGVYLEKKTGKWYAQVRLGGKSHHLGTFDTEERAAEVAAAFRAEHMPYTTN